MEVTHKPLTKQELKKMSTKGAMPAGAELWARTVALQTTQTQQQIATVREILDMPYYTRKDVCVWDDKIVKITNKQHYQRTKAGSWSNNPRNAQENTEN